MNLNHKPGTFRIANLFQDRKNVFRRYIQNSIDYCWLEYTSICLSPVAAVSEQPLPTLPRKRLGGTALLAPGTGTAHILKQLALSLAAEAWREQHLRLHRFPVQSESLSTQRSYHTNS